MQQVNARPTGRRQYQFGPYRLDLEERRLWRNGDTVALTARVFDVLAVLVANSGRPIDKDEIMRQVWPDSIVEEGNLTRNVSTLRKVLGDSPEDHQYIITLPGRGYQFVQPVQEILHAEFKEARAAAMAASLNESDAKVSNEPHAKEVAAVKGVRHRTYAIVALAVLLAALTWFALELRWKETRLPRTQTLAVLPFQLLSSEPADEHDRGRESILLPLPPNRTSGSPAYGSPVGGFTWLRIDELTHQRIEIPADKQRSVLFSRSGSSTCLTLIATVSSALQPLKPLQLA